MIISAFLSTTYIGCGFNLSYSDFNFSLVVNAVLSLSIELAIKAGKPMFLAACFNNSSLIILEVFIKLDNAAVLALVTSLLLTEGVGLFAITSLTVLTSP